jgi:hypothetical protein
MRRSIFARVTQPLLGPEEIGKARAGNETTAGVKTSLASKPLFGHQFSRSDFDLLPSFSTESATSRLMRRKRGRQRGGLSEI